MSIPTHLTAAEAIRDVGADPDRDGFRGGSIAGASAFRIESVSAGRTRRPPHRTGYFAVVLLERGRGRYSLDGAEQDARPGLVYFARPGHVKAYVYTDAPAGWVVTFTEAFLKAHAHADVTAAVPFLVAEPVLSAYTDPATFEALGELAAQIAAEIRRPSPVRAPLVAAYLVVLLLRLSEAFDLEDGAGGADRAAAITRSFRHDLEAGLRALVAGETAAAPSVADLAEAQGIHPDHLSAVVKRSTGRTPSEWTAEALAAEARGLLADPAASVKAAAYRLGFSEPTAFSRFFRRETGQSPSGFQRDLARSRVAVGAEPMEAEPVDADDRTGEQGT